MKYQMNSYRHPWRRRIRQFLRDYCGGPYTLPASYSYNGQPTEDPLVSECGYLLIRGNRWRLAAWLVMALWLLTLWLAATGQLGAPLN